MQQSRQSGLSLVELATTLCVLATGATLALPGFQDVVQRRQTEGVAAELASDLLYLRSEAVARNQPLRISFSSRPDGASCYVLHSGSASACTCETDGAAACSGDAESLKAVLVPNARRTSVQANVASVLYDPRHGTSSPTATLRVTGRDGRAVHHVVNIMGRVRSCSPNRSFGGYAAC